jgi:hypothetical protein
LATNELDATPLTPQERLDGDKGQGHAERGFRFLKDPHVLASSLYLKKPARIMALTPSAQRPGGDRSRPTRQTDSQSAGTLGVAVFCGHSLAVSGRPMADCAESDRGTSALAPSPWPTVQAVL